MNQEVLHVETYLVVILKVLIWCLGKFSSLNIGLYEIILITLFLLLSEFHLLSAYCKIYIFNKINCFILHYLTYQYIGKFGLSNFTTVMKYLSSC